MIKTTSFALTRPSQTASPTSSAQNGRQRAIKVAKARAASQPTLGDLFPAPTPLPEISASQAREIIQGAAPKSKTKAAAVVQPSLTLPLSPASVEKSVAVAPLVPPAAVVPPTIATKKTPRAAKIVALPVEAPVAVVTPVEIVPAENVVVVDAPKKSVAEPKKSKRARVPGNLAEQYGQNLSKRVESGVEAATVEEDAPKKRMSRAERAARRELMTPDEDFLARLQRIQNAVPTAKAEKRPRGWRFDCGRCGQTSYFQTNGAVCHCGAFALKD